MWYTSDLVPALTNKEVAVTVYMDFMIPALNASGLNMKWVDAEEGNFADDVFINVVKDAPNKELAQLFIDFALEKETQEKFTQLNNESPTNKLAEVSPEQDELICYGQEEFDNCTFFDYNRLNELKPCLLYTSLPEQCVDPIVAAAQIVTGLQNIVARRISAYDTAVLSVCQIHGGDAYNIIPGEVTITGSVRTFSKELRNNMPCLLYTSIIVKGHNDTVIRLGMDLSKTKIPYDTVNGFNIRLADSCIKESEIILPQNMPIVGGDISIYPENAVMYGNDRAEAEDITGDEMEISFGDETKTIELKEIGKTDDNKEDLTVLFLGDSLINENYYTEAVKKLNPHITFLGTRGNADAPHEGRGGWSAYDLSLIHI